MTPYTEDYLVEQPAIQRMQHEQGWDVVNCYGEWALLRPARRDYEGQDGVTSDLGRDGKPSSLGLQRPKREAVLTSGLKSALHGLKPDLPFEAIERAVEEICRDRTALSLVEGKRGNINERNQ